MHMTLNEIARLLEGRVLGDGGLRITGISGLREAQEGDLSFLAHPKYAPLLKETKASAVIAGENTTLPERLAAVIVKDPNKAFTKVIEQFASALVKIKREIHPTAVIAEGVTLGPNVAVGAYAVIEEGASIGAGTTIYPHVYLGHRTAIGQDCLIYPRVVVRERCIVGNRVTLHAGAVIGSDGFGFAAGDGRREKIPQVGVVVIEDDVSIGANTTIDRARFDKTVIRKGTKIDNLVQIAHNVQLGENCALAAQVGIAGSTRIGNNVLIGGQAGLNEHIEIGDNTLIGAQSGVMKTFPPGSILAGYPARPRSQTLRQHAVLQSLAEDYERLRSLLRKAETLETHPRTR